MANSSIYDDQFLTEEQKRQVQAFKREWERASAAGDRAGMDAAHAAAERVRARSGYSGGADGSGYTALPGTEDAYMAAQLKTYRPQTDAVNRAYDAARAVQLAELKTAYDENNATLEAQRAEIPERYQVKRNAVGAQSEVAGRNFNEYAAASGLNSGTGGQAELARANQLQGDLSALSRQEAAEQRDLEERISQLRVQYQNEVAAAIARGEYERAAALLEEYRRAEESAVSVAQAQADEDYRAWEAAYQQAQNDQSQANWEKQFAYEQEQDSQARELENYQNRLKKAQLQAEYGDLSGLQALGVDTSEYERRLAANGTAVQSAVQSGEPTLTWPQTQAQIEAGNLSPGVLSAYRYYMGEDYRPAENEEADNKGTAGLHADQRGLLDPGQDASNRDRFLYSFTQSANAGTDLQTLYDMLDTAADLHWITEDEARRLKVQAEANYAVWFANK